MLQRYKSLNIINDSITIINESLIKFALDFKNIH